MKFPKSMQWTLIVMLVVLFLPVISSCGGSSSNNDEPEEPSTTKNQLTPAQFSGKWIIESFTDITGNETKINKTFTVMPFEVVDPNGQYEVEDGREYWGFNYPDIISVNTINGDTANDGILETGVCAIAFSKKKGASIKTAVIHELLFQIPEYDAIGYTSVILSELTFSNNTLKSGYAVYGFSSDGEDPNIQVGTIIMRKL